MLLEQNLHRIDSNERTVKTTLYAVPLRASAQIRVMLYLTYQAPRPPAHMRMISRPQDQAWGVLKSAWGEVY